MGLSELWLMRRLKPRPTSEGKDSSRSPSRMTDRKSKTTVAEKQRQQRVLRSPTPTTRTCCGGPLRSRLDPGNGRNNLHVPSLLDRLRVRLHGLKVGR
jgi:hypothetical protein